MGFFGKLKNMFFPGSGKAESTPEKSGKKSKPPREQRKIKPSKKREDYMDDHADGPQDFDDRYTRLSPGRDMMSPEVVKSFNEFSQLLHNINIKMASQNDQNMALLQSLESLPAIIRDIPRARELEGDILQEIHILLKSTHEDKLKVADRLLDIKSAMMAMEENSKAQISFFEGKERGHRDQMNMMREFIEREKKHHRNNLTGIVFIVILFIGVLCAGAFFFIREKLNSMEQSIDSKMKEVEIETRSRGASGAAVAPPQMVPSGSVYQIPAGGNGSVQPRVEQPAVKGNGTDQKPANGTSAAPDKTTPEPEKTEKPVVPFE